MKLKTNMIMDVKIDGHPVRVEHKTGLVDVNDLLKVGNMLRASKMLLPMTITRIRRSKDLMSFSEAVQRQIDSGHYQYFDVPDELIFATGKGAGSTTKAFLPVAIKIAALMDSDFEAEVYRVFIEEKILHYRDESGEEFKALNLIIDSYLPGREGKDNRGVYIAVAKQIRAKVFPDVAWDPSSQGNIWNSELATAEALRRRAKIESDLISTLRLELIQSFDHLKEVITKL